MTMNVKIPVIAILGGVAITLLTGLVSSTPAGLVGARWYGFPLPWLFRLIVAPQYFPWKVDALNLIADLIFWIIVVGIVAFIIKIAKK